MRFSTFLRWLMLTPVLMCSPAFSAEWTKSPAPFDATAISRSGAVLWICGPNAAIASSSDGGSHWSVRNSKTDGGTLLSIGWADEKLGFAGGTFGLLLLTTDGGAAWHPVSTWTADPVLAASFADAQHGMIVTTSAVLYTGDGGKSWQKALPSTSPELTRFKFVLEIAALDASHAAALVKAGPGQSYDGRMVTTAAGGQTWKTTELEHTTLNNLLVVDGEYWLVGTEVIDRENHGGHAVPVTFHSHDGVAWNRGPKPPIDTNDACRPEGCLMRNGAWFDPFITDGKVHWFPPAQGLTPQWSAIGTRICALIPDLECVDSVIGGGLDKTGLPPQLAASALRPTTADLAGKCIRCDYPQILVNQKFSGKAIVELSISTLPDGTVSAVKVLKTPNPEVGANLARAAQAWVFYPVLHDGAASAAKQTVKLPVMVIKPN